MTRSSPMRGSPAHIVFGNGARDDVGEWIEKLGCSRALVLVDAAAEGGGGGACRPLGAPPAGVFTGAAMHTPVEVTEEAVAARRRAGADCLVSLGGGSTTGLGKAIAFRTDLPQIVVPTTYAGSEVTPSSARPKKA